MKLLRLLFLVLLWLAFGAPMALAQLEVDLSLDNTAYLKYEPITANVKVSNFSGNVVGLFNHDDKPWLSFYVSRPNGEQVASLGVEYDLHQIQIARGDSITIHVNLTPVYNIREPGMYRVMAFVYSATYSRQFRSNIRQFDLTEGRVLWAETIAVVPTNAPPPSALISTNVPLRPPPAEDLRSYVLVSKPLARGDRLYARVESKLKNLVYATVPLGDLLGFGKPETKVDKLGHLHILHQVGARAFAYQEIDPDGNVIEQKLYSNVLSRPELKANDNGTVLVLGGEQTYPNTNVQPLPETGEASDKN